MHNAPWQNISILTGFPWGPQMYCTHLVEIELAGEYHDIGPLRVESHRLDVGYVDLCRNVHLDPYRACIEYSGYVACYYGGDRCLLCRIDYGMTLLDVGVKYYGVDSEICLYPM